MCALEILASESGGYRRLAYFYATAVRFRSWPARFTVARGTVTAAAGCPHIGAHPAAREWRFLILRIECGDDQLLFGFGELMHRALGAETDPADRCSAGKVFSFRPVVPVNREACGADHADGVGDGILRNVEDNLDATLARLKRLTGHETSMKQRQPTQRPSLRHLRMLLKLTVKGMVGVTLGPLV